MADRTAAFVHITTLIRQSIVCEKYESLSLSLSLPLCLCVCLCDWDIESDS